MMRIPLILCPVIFLSSNSNCADVIDKNLVLSNIDRSIDITSQIVKITNAFTLQNKGSGPISYFIFAADKNRADHIAFISGVTGEGKNSHQLVSTQVTGEADRVLWKFKLRDDLQPGKKIVVTVKTYSTHVLTPFPSSITQKEKQLILYKENAYVYSPYVIAKQTTTIKVGTKNIESYTKLKPVSLNELTVVYGPYENIAPFSVAEISVHYENNTPFLTVTQMDRIVELSHWGNIAIEETVSMTHKGALLKGSFSRYEFQRDAQSGHASVKSFKTILPAAAKDVYYRDDIGNISTSHLRPLSDSMELDLRPRFPIFGGWKTKYTVGYNVPSYEYLYNSGDNFVLKMRVLDHIFDEMVVEQLTTKIILPEGVKNVQLKTPYSVVRLPDEKHFTYLDTIGRTVVVLQSKNLLENHIQDFELSYIFPKILMLQEPLLAVCGFFFLFLLGIIFVRLDLAISSVSTVKKDN